MQDPTQRHDSETQRTMYACASTYVALCGVWALLLAGFIGLAVVKGAAVMDGVVTIAAVLIFLMAWVRSFRIDLSVNGIVYHSPFFRRAVVKWADLASVSSGASWRRTKWPFYMLIETHDASRPVRINIKVFGRGDLSALAATIRRRSPQATLDKATHRMSQGQMPSMLRRKSDSQGTA